MPDSYSELQQKCRTLRLADRRGTTYYEFINQVLGYDLNCREEKNRSKLMKWLESPQQLTLVLFNFAEQSAIGEKQLNILKELS